MPILKIAEEGQKQRETGEPLLAVHDVANTLLLADDDRSEKIVRIVGYFAARMRWIVFLQELVAEVVHELANLLFMPFVFALVVVYRVFHALEQLADGLGFAKDLSHLEPPLRMSPNSPSVSRSNAKMSAWISSSVRSGWGL